METKAPETKITCFASCYTTIQTLIKCRTRDTDSVKCLGMTSGSLNLKEAEKKGETEKEISRDVK